MSKFHSTTTDELRSKNILMPLIDIIESYTLVKLPCVDSKESVKIINDEINKMVGLPVHQVYLRNTYGQTRGVSRDDMCWFIIVVGRNEELVNIIHCKNNTWSCNDIYGYKHKVHNTTQLQEQLMHHLQL